MGSAISPLLTCSLGVWKVEGGATYFPQEASEAHLDSLDSSTSPYDPEFTPAARYVCFVR